MPYIDSKANKTTPFRRQVRYAAWRTLPANALGQVIARVERLGEDAWPEISAMRQRLYELKIQEFASKLASTIMR